MAAVSNWYENLDSDVKPLVLCGDARLSVCLTRDHLSKQFELTFFISSFEVEKVEDDFSDVVATHYADRVSQVAAIDRISRLEDLVEELPKGMAKILRKKPKDYVNKFYDRQAAVFQIDQMLSVLSNDPFAELDVPTQTAQILHGKKEASVSNLPEVSQIIEDWRQEKKITPDQSIGVISVDLEVAEEEPVETVVTQISPVEQNLRKIVPAQYANLLKKDYKSEEGQQRLLGLITSSKIIDDLTDIDVDMTLRVEGGQKLRHKIALAVAAEIDIINTYLLARQKILQGSDESEQDPLFLLRALDKKAKPGSLVRHLIDCMLNNAPGQLPQFSLEVNIEVELSTGHKVTSKNSLGLQTGILPLCKTAEEVINNFLKTLEVEADTVRQLLGASTPKTKNE